MKAIFLSLALCSIFVACGGDGAPAPTATVAAPTATATPDPLEEEISTTVIGILKARASAADLAAWASVEKAKHSHGTLTLTYICDDVPKSFGYKGFQVDSLWPAKYTDLDRAVASLCDVAADSNIEGNPQQMLAFAYVVQETLAEHEAAGAASTETFDIKNEVRQRAVERGD